MRKGFTLIELSIVLVIVGLLVAGVLVGQSLIQSAKINRLVSDLRQYDVAITQFKNKFKKYPGDDAFFNPPGAPDNTLGYGDTDGNGTPNITDCNGLYGNDEKTQVWSRLSLSKMLSKTYPIYSPIQCGGTHINFYDNQANAGIVWPYIEVDPAELGVSKYPILAYKFNAAATFSLFFRTNPLDAGALENKMGSNSTQIGLVNNFGAGLCPDGDDQPVLCSDPTAGSGEFIYYIAP